MTVRLEYELVRTKLVLGVTVLVASQPFMVWLISRDIGWRRWDDVVTSCIVDGLYIIVTVCWLVAELRAPTYTFEVSEEGIAKRGRDTCVEGRWGDLVSFRRIDDRLLFRDGTRIRLRYGMMEMPLYQQIQVAHLCGRESPLFKPIEKKAIFSFGKKRGPELLAKWDPNRQSDES